MLLAILSPELPLLFAAGQWSSAKRSMAFMKEQCYDEWTMVYSFYADAGGFVLQARHSKPFPLMARQLGKLIAGNYLETPTISRRKIWDQSKSDRSAKGHRLPSDCLACQSDVSSGGTEVAGDAARVDDCWHHRLHRRHVLLLV
jgi:hypothetical protein